MCSLLLSGHNELIMWPRYSINYLVVTWLCSMNAFPAYFPSAHRSVLLTMVPYWGFWWLKKLSLLQLLTCYLYCVGLKQTSTVHLNRWGSLKYTTASKCDQQNMEWWTISPPPFLFFIFIFFFDWVLAAQIVLFLMTKMLFFYSCWTYLRHLIPWIMVSC